MCEAVGFWSSVILTGNQTPHAQAAAQRQFWSSAILTGNQTPHAQAAAQREFWSSVILTGEYPLTLSYITKVIIIYNNNLKPKEPDMDQVVVMFFISFLSNFLAAVLADAIRKK